MSSAVGAVNTAAIKSLIRLRRYTLFAASQFSDYNFRSFFVAKTRGDYEALKPQLEAGITPDAMAALLKQKRQDLAQMRRMACVNSMYSHVPVAVQAEAESADAFGTEKKE